MLSLASNISSTQVVESKYSASFDGIDDFIDTNQTFQSVFRGDFSISFWIKPSDGRCSEMIFGVDNDSNDDGNSGGRAEVYFQLQSDGSPRFVFTAAADVGVWKATGNGGFNFSDGAQSSWTHFVVTMNLQSSGNSIGKIYVNGVDKTTEQANIPSANHANYTSDLSLLLAARSVEGSALNHYEGGLDEFAIFNTVLDSDAVTAIYNNGSPLNLKFDQGNYDNSSALQAYYRMGNGLFDDKANGIVHDQDNPGFGSNLVTWDGSTTSDWSLAYPNTTLSANSGRLRATANASGAYGVSQSFTTVVGKVYKVDFNINVDNAEGGSGNLRVATDSVLGSNITTLSTSTEIGTGYFTAVATTTHIGLVDTADDSSNYLELESISVKELNGNPGLTSGGVTFSSDTP
jgi:hypothetical protein